MMERGTVDLPTGTVELKSVASSMLYMPHEEEDLAVQTHEDGQNETQRKTRGGRKIARALTVHTHTN